MFNLIEAKLTQVSEHARALRDLPSFDAHLRRVDLYFLRLVQHEPDPLTAEGVLERYDITLPTSGPPGGLLETTGQYVEGEDYGVL